MPYIDLALCPLCHGSTRMVATSEAEGIAGSITPCACESGVEAITEDGEVIGILGHGQAQENPTQSSPTP